VEKGGHYEMVEKKQTKYFYVSDEEPIQQNGAFIVSKFEADQF
jgi:hypothetical protein